MASYYAIAAVSNALRGVLSTARPPELEQITIDVLQVTDFQKMKPIEEGLSIFLYRVAISAMPRTLSSRFDEQGRRKPPPLPVDLYYMITPWGRSAAMQQRILGWAMRTLEDISPINAATLNHFGGPEEIFSEDETVSLIFEPLPLQDLSNVWDILKPNAQVSVGYVARMVELETLLQPEEGSLVQTREFQYAKGPQ